MGPHEESGHLPASDVVLKDGSTVQVSELRSEDEAGLTALFSNLSPRALRNRFFSLGKTASRFAHEEVQTIDNHFALVARAGAAHRIVGHACFHQVDGAWAEPGFAVADNYQGRGLGTLLLGQLAQVAEVRGIRQFRAVVLPDNYRMLDVFRESGFALEIESQPGVMEVRFPTSLTPAAAERFSQRERLAAVSAVSGFLRPQSIAVIGASRERNKVGGQTFRNLLEYGFQGPVYPVNPTAGVVQSVLAYPDLESVPGPVDLAVLAVPAGLVQRAAEACGWKGVKAVAVLTSGFAEAGVEGQKRQALLLETCRSFGMRMVGPNCLGVVNTDPTVAMNAMFTPTLPPAGNIAFASQSGALGLAAMDYAASLGLGISSFVSLGNKADISSNDLLCYWEEDPRTDVILLYLESFGNPRRFNTIARRLSRKKPIIVVKSGKSSAGARAASSHTGALLAASDRTVDALFHHAGVIRTDTLQEMFAVASLLAHQPAPKGRRVGILTNAGGPAILCADTCDAEGLEVPVLGAETQASLRAFLPSQASVGNPVDMIATAKPEDYRAALDLMVRDPAIDSAIAIFIPPLAVRSVDVARAVSDAAGSSKTGKPVLAVFMSSTGAQGEWPEGTPRYSFPEDAARALAHAVRYGERRARPEAALARPPGLMPEKAAALIAAQLGLGAEWLAPQQVAELFKCYGLPLLDQRLVSSSEEAEEAAVELGGAVALKAVAPGLLHKSDAGGVRLGLLGGDQVRDAAEAMRKALALAGYVPSGYLVQRMAPAGVEMLLGVADDRRFGPIIAFGAGGTSVELLGDVQFRLAPLERADITEMVEGLRTYPLLTGYRGHPPCDIGAIGDILTRTTAMVEDLPQIMEMDCNPLIVLQRGAVIADARVRIKPAELSRPLGTRE